MKSYYVFALFILVLILGSCATHQTVVKTLEPSPISISKNVKKIGIINNNVLDVVMQQSQGLDELVAQENKWLIQNGTAAAIDGLFNELTKDHRFGAIKLLQDVPDEHKYIETQANTISWSSIAALCELYDVDVIFSLSYYNAKTNFSLKKSSMLEADLMRVNVKVPAQELTLETLIENGWRIYDPKTKEVLDEIVFNDQFTAKGKGFDAIAAFNQIERRDTILNKSKIVGSNYGLRLLPSEKEVEQYFYVRGTKKFATAKRMVLDENWENAVALWKEEVKNEKLKISSKACHNLAVYSERVGDLEMALQWASKAYKNHITKETSVYLESLKDRIAKHKLSQQQLVSLE